MYINGGDHLLNTVDNYDCYCVSPVSVGFSNLGHSDADREHPRHLPHRDQRWQQHR